MQCVGFLGILIWANQLQKDRFLWNANDDWSMVGMRELESHYFLNIIIKDWIKKESSVDTKSRENLGVEYSHDLKIVSCKTEKTVIIPRRNQMIKFHIIRERETDELSLSQSGLLWQNTIDLWA